MSSNLDGFKPHLSCGPSFRNLWNVVQSSVNVDMRTRVWNKANSVIKAVL